jgi:hypothetical protein
VANPFGQLHRSISSPGSPSLPAQTGHTTIAGDDIVSVIAAAKQQPGGDMVVEDVPVGPFPAVHAGGLIVGCRRRVASW